MFVDLFVVLYVLVQVQYKHGNLSTELCVVPPQLISTEGNQMWYHRYERHMPLNQVKLLSLGDKLGIPHQPHKQIFGLTLTIIGIYVNLNGLTFSLSKQALNELLQEIENFAVWSEKKHGASWTLQKWQ